MSGLIRFPCYMELCFDLNVFQNYPVSIKISELFIMRVAHALTEVAMP